MDEIFKLTSSQKSWESYWSNNTNYQTIQTILAEYVNSQFIDGWFPTGDLARYDDDGFFYIVGKTKEMIKVRGWQVSPYELEEVINDIPGVEMCAVVGIPDNHSGQLPKAFIKCKEGAKIAIADIHQSVTRKLASYKRLAGGIEFIENLPMTPSGKIARHMLL